MGRVDATEARCLIRSSPAPKGGFAFARGRLEPDDFKRNCEAIPSDGQIRLSTPGESVMSLENRFQLFGFML